MARVLTALGQVVRTSVQIDRSKLSADVALRATIGVGVCLVAGELSGHPLVGVTASIGALTGGFASFQGTYRTRAGAVMVASAGMALSAFVGGTVGYVLGYDIAVTALWGFVAGLLVALGQTATVVGLQSVVGLVVFSQFRFTPAVAARDAGLVLLGGLVPALLVVVVWPLRRFPLERRALSEAYAQLADYAGQVPTRSAPLLPLGAFDPLDPVLKDPQPFGGGVETAAHTALANQAERIRLDLIALGRVRQRLWDAGDREAARVVDDFALAASSSLGAISTSLRAARVPVGWELERDRMEGAISTIAARGTQPDGWWQHAALEEARRICQALAGQLRAAVRIAAIPAGGVPAALEEAAITGRPIPAHAARPRLFDIGRAREGLATLRANLALSSEACRHGLRLAVALSAAVGLSHALGLAHRYWFPLTVMLVLKPDFTSTLTRGISRIVGTLVGAGLVTVALAELRPGRIGLTILVLIWCFAANTFLFANYGIFSVCMASLVVTLLAFTGQPEPSLAAERCIYTVAGAALALLAYVVWPTWAATYLPERLAALVTTEGGYGRAVLCAWADPAAADREMLQRARLNARLARSNAEAAVDRWMSEPTRPGPLTRETVLGVLAAVRAYVLGVIALHAGLPSEGPSRPELLPFAGDVERAMSAVAASLATVRPPGTWPPLRAEQVALAEKLGFARGTGVASGLAATGGAGNPAPGGPVAGGVVAEGAGAAGGSAPGGVVADGAGAEGGPAVGDQGHSQALVLTSETDLIVDAVDTLGHVVGLTPAGAG